MEKERLKKSEQTALLLRDIYEQYGYEKFAMSKFEEYDFYVKNRDFLGSGQILTFTDLSGRLMALKPDVTMSIVKNTRATRAHPERLYYSESVYRANTDAKEFREITQIGVEHIGEVTLYAQAEIISLALRSLAEIHEKYVLDIGHAGFLRELLFELKPEVSIKVAGCIERKCAHELNSLLTEYEVDDKTASALRGIVNMKGNLGDALIAVRPYIKNDAMQSAFDELSVLNDLFYRQRSKLRLDFSITSNSKYYNGLMLRGYVESIPTRVLSGGRYDPLMARMGKPDLQAIGFAVYFDEVERSLFAPSASRYDAIVLYNDNTDISALHAFVEKLIADGERVYAAKALPPSPGAAKIYTSFDGANKC